MCLILLDKEEQARRILAPFSWGEQFLLLNAEPLNAYKNAETREQLVELQWEFFDKPID
jgi:pre-rRNA-processing protein TSR3